MREPELKEYFSTYGPVSRVYIAYDKETRESRGFGSVYFLRQKDAAKAIAELNGTDDTKADVKDEMYCRACSKKGDHSTLECPSLILAKLTGTKPENVEAARGDREPSNLRLWNGDNCVRVTNLSDDTREPELEACFGIYGPVNRVHIACDEAGMPRGYGYVNFVNHSDAERSILKHYGSVEWAAPRAQ